MKNAVIALNMALEELKNRLEEARKEMLEEHSDQFISGRVLALTETCEILENRIEIVRYYD